MIQQGTIIILEKEHTFLGRKLITLPKGTLVTVIDVCKDETGFKRLTVRHDNEFFIMYAKHDIVI